MISLPSLPSCGYHQETLVSHKAEGINHFCEIKSIYLQKNIIGSKGAAAMMEALKNSIYLESVIV